MSDMPGIAAAVHRAAAMHRDTRPDLCAALRRLVILGESIGEGPQWEAAQVAARHLAWLEGATETTACAIEWTSLDADDPARFQPYHDPRIAARLVDTYPDDGGQVVQRDTLHGRWYRRTT